MDERLCPTWFGIILLVTIIILFFLCVVGTLFLASWLDYRSVVLSCFMR
jgi:hypothetical protein